MHTVENFKYKFGDETDYYTIEDNDGILSFVKMEGSHSGGKYDSHWNKHHDDTGNSNSGKFSAATAAQPPRDPLVIDLGTPGIDLTTIDDGVYFDLDKNGFAEKTAWIGTEDGFLVLDRNGNGVIDDGGELFSDQVEMSDGSISASGFAALSDLDENGDGIIDANDAKFADLSVWVDGNHDGSFENELHSLEELGITSISLNHIQTDTVDSDTGTIVTESLVVTFANGTVREISEHWFQINSADTEEITVTDVENDLTSFGNMHSLTYALETDESGELQALVNSFKNTDSFIEKRVLARKILYFITGSSDIAVNSRGGAIDARSLHVLETIMGVESFVGVNGSTTPNSNAATILNQLFADFDRTYFTLLNKVLGDADYLELIEEIPDDDGNIVLDLLSVEDMIDQYVSLGMNVDDMLYNIGVYLKTYDSTYGTNYLNAFKSHYPDRLDEISIMVNGNFVVGTDGNDTLNGTNTQDVIWAESGDDRISTGSGNDIIYSGAGSDTLYGENGNDILNGGADNDTFYGGAGDELSADDYFLHIDINNGISLVNTETGETISVPDFINMLESYEFIFEEDSQIIGGGDSRQIIEGTDEDDTITGGNGFNIIRGNGGNDIITGGDNLNFIYGGDGDDTITGGNGTNIIRGENGNDIIHDGSGDSYLDGGEGDDTIYGGDGSDELHGENGDDIIAGNAGNDTLYADAGNDELHGDNGNDSLFGGDGDDILYGDDGDDYLEAGNGTDTLYGGIGNDTFVGDEGINYMYGEDGDDTFYGGNALNYMYGGDGDDNFTGGELADYIEGGFGNDTMNGGNGNNEMYGGDGDDYIYGGNDDDYIEGGNGDDHLYGGNGVNTIYSGAGNDYLQGDHDGDIYIFGIGYDMDTINASADLNKVVIHGYTVADMRNTRMANNDLVIDFGENTGDRMVIQGFFNFNSNCDFNFIFDDGTVLGQYDIQAISAPIYGTDADEWLSVQGNDSGIIHAGGGNDGLSGGSGNDELYGEDGDDALYGNDGNDILDGGTGNDSLNGGNGEDTYIFAKGYAQDTINEWGSDHSIVELISC